MKGLPWTSSLEDLTISSYLPAVGGMYLASAFPLPKLLTSTSSILPLGNLICSDMILMLSKPDKLISIGLLAAVACNSIETGSEDVPCSPAGFAISMDMNGAKYSATDISSMLELVISAGVREGSIPKEYSAMAIALVMLLRPRSSSTTLQSGSMPGRMTLIRAVR